MNHYPSMVLCHFAGQFQILGSGEKRTNHTKSNKMQVISPMNLRLMKPASKRAFAAALGLATLVFHPLTRAQAMDQNTAIAKDAAPMASAGSAKLSNADLAKDLQNPVANMISVPLENRVDVGPGSIVALHAESSTGSPLRATRTIGVVVSRTILPIFCAPKPIGGEPSLDSVEELRQLGKAPAWAVSAT